MTLICCVCTDNDHSLPWIENDGQDQGTVFSIDGNAVGLTSILDRRSFSSLLKDRL